MFTLPGLICLLVYLLVRPFYFVPSLRTVPFLYIFFGLAVLGFGVDVARGRIKGLGGPHLPWVIALVVWAHVSIVVFTSDSIGSDIEIILAPLLYFLITHAITGEPEFSRLAGTFLGCSLVVSAACAYQGLQPRQCLEFNTDDRASISSDDLGKPTGVLCSDVGECYDALYDPEISFKCEHVGPGECQSVEGRVRFVGVLADPNEAAMTVSLGLPIAIARFQRRPKFGRLLTLLLTVVLAAMSVVFTQSRGGQLVFGAILGVYFVGRFRWKGLVLAALMALPVVALGGRSGAEAEASSEGRLEVQGNGLDMFIQHPLAGVGHGQYLEHSSHTAHNSFVFTPAELGLPGLVTWAVVMWISLKIVIVALRELPREGAAIERLWAMALLATLLGILLGIAFLTFNYHYVLWTIIGMTGGYYRYVSAKYPQITLRIDSGDVAIAAGANLTILVILFITLKLNGLR